MKEKLTIQVHGQVIGHPYEDESIEQATARLVLGAEIEVNNLNFVRIHLNAVDPSLAEIFGDGIIRNDAPQDLILSRGAPPTIADKIATINRLVTEVCEHKRTHILDRVGYYPHSTRQHP